MPNLEVCCILSEYLSAGNQAFQAPFPGTVNQDYQKGRNEEQDGLTAAPLNGEYQVRKMHHKVGYQHFNSGYGGRQPGENSQGDSSAPDELYDSSKPEQAAQFNWPHVREHAEQLLGPVKGKQE